MDGGKQHARTQVQEQSQDEQEQTRHNTTNVNTLPLAILTKTPTWLYHTSQRFHHVMSAVGFLTDDYDDADFVADEIVKKRWYHHLLRLAYLLPELDWVLWQGIEARCHHEDDDDDDEGVNERNHPCRQMRANKQNLPSATQKGSGERRRKHLILLSSRSAPEFHFRLAHPLSRCHFLSIIIMNEFLSYLCSAPTVTGQSSLSSSFVFSSPLLLLLIFFFSFLSSCNLRTFFEPQLRPWLHRYEIAKPLHEKEREDNNRKSEQTNSGTNYERKQGNKEAERGTGTTKNEKSCDYVALLRDREITGKKTRTAEHEQQQ